MGQCEVIPRPREVNEISLDQIQAGSCPGKNKKANLSYLSPLPLTDDYMPEQLQKSLKQIPELDVKTQCAIEAIKVKWGSFIKIKKESFKADYIVIKEIGKGGYGQVFEVMSKYSKLVRAAKRIKKSQLAVQDHKKLFQEMAILMKQDHPNIIKLYEIYDSDMYYHLVMEICEGGELAKRIHFNPLTKEQIALVTKQLLRCLIYLHSQCIVHRDIKLENILLQSTNLHLKLIDFGIAVKIEPGQKLKKVTGTLVYMAPEVLTEQATEKCDLWAVGVALYKMITQRFPFDGANMHSILDAIKHRDPFSKYELLKDVEPQCLDLIKKLLQKDPNKRLSAAQAYAHPWLAGFSEPDHSEDSEVVLNKITGFNVRTFVTQFEDEFTAVIYTYIVSQLLTSEEKKDLIDTFREVDGNNDGVLSTIQLKEALQKKNKFSAAKVDTIMKLIDMNSSGYIDYTEFLVAGLDPKVVLTSDHFEKSFAYFDLDHSNTISLSEVKKFIDDKSASGQSVEKMFSRFDVDNDGVITKKEFYSMLMDCTRHYLEVIAKSIQENESPSAKQYQTAMLTIESLHSCKIIPADNNCDLYVTC